MVAIASGATALMGSGATHYQDRKFAVVWPSPNAHHFFFRFYQYSSSDETLLSNLECGNAAALCAAFALMHRLAQLNLDGSLSAENLGTGQRIRLSPEDSAAALSCSWEVRFVQEDFSLPSIDCQHFTAGGDSGAEVSCTLLERGNSFLFAQIDPVCADAAAAALLKASAARLRQTTDGERFRPKVVSYEIDSVNGDWVRLRASCWFDGELHRSLPGSAAMSLCGFLTLSALAADPPEADRGTFRFDVETPSAELEVVVDWVSGPFGYQVVETGFRTLMGVHFVGNMLWAEARC